MVFKTIDESDEQYFTQQRLIRTQWNNKEHNVTIISTIGTQLEKHFERDMYNRQSEDPINPMS